MRISTIWMGFEPLDCKFEPFKRDSKHSNGNSNHSNGIRNIQLQTWTTRMQVQAILTGFEPFEQVRIIQKQIRTTHMQIRAIQTGFEPFECKFEPLESDSNHSNVIFEPFECEFQPIERDSNHSNANSNHSNGNLSHSNGNLSHSNGIRIIRMRIQTTWMQIRKRFKPFECYFWTTRMRISTNWTGFEPFECKFKPLEWKFEPFERDSNHSNANLNNLHANSSHSNRIWTIRMQIWTTQMQIRAIRKRFEPFECYFWTTWSECQQFEQDSKHWNANLNHSNTNSKHSNGISSIRMQIRTTRMQIRTIRMGFETFNCKFEPLECEFQPFKHVWIIRKFKQFQCKFETLECEFQPFQQDLKHSNTNSSHLNGIRKYQAGLGDLAQITFHVWCMYTYIHIHVHMYICILIWNDQSSSHFTYVLGPCRAKLLRAREEAFWTSTSEDCSRWMSGSKMVSDIGSVTEWGCEGVMVWGISVWAIVHKCAEECCPMQWQVSRKFFR